MKKTLTSIVFLFLTFVSLVHANTNDSLVALLQSDGYSTMPRAVRIQHLQGFRSRLYCQMAENYFAPSPHHKELLAASTAELAKLMHLTDARNEAGGDIVASGATLDAMVGAVALTQKLFQYGYLTQSLMKRWGVDVELHSPEWADALYKAVGAGTYERTDVTAHYAMIHAVGAAQQYFTGENTEAYRGNVKAYLQAKEYREFYQTIDLSGLVAGIAAKVVSFDFNAPKMQLQAQTYVGGEALSHKIVKTFFLDAAGVPPVSIWDDLRKKLNPSMEITAAPAVARAERAALAGLVAPAPRDTDFDFGFGLSELGGMLDRAFGVGGTHMTVSGGRSGSLRAPAYDSKINEGDFVAPGQYGGDEYTEVGKGVFYIKDAPTILRFVTRPTFKGVKLRLRTIPNCSSYSSNSSRSNGRVVSHSHIARASVTWFYELYLVSDAGRADTYVGTFRGTPKEAVFTETTKAALDAKLRGEDIEVVF